MAACLNPVFAWMASEPNENGRVPLVFRPDLADLETRVAVPCGKCLPCANHKGITVAVRIVHDWQMHHGVGCFITLTYALDKRPPGGGLSPSDLAAFHHRARDWARRNGLRWRTVSVGEFGGRTGHPHYHLVLLGIDLTEGASLKFYSNPGQQLYDSPLLNRLWPHGEVTVSPMNEGRAKYMGLHFVKSFGVPGTAECYKPPRRPGLGAGWLEKYAGDLLKGFVTIDGEKFPIPASYLSHPEFYDYLEPLRQKRREYALALRREDVEAESATALNKAVNLRARRELKRRGN